MLVLVRTFRARLCPVISEMCSGWRGTHRDLHNGQDDLGSDLQEVQGAPAEGRRGWAGKMAVGLPLFPNSTWKDQREGKRNGFTIPFLFAMPFSGLSFPLIKMSRHSISAVK